MEGISSEQLGAPLFQPASTGTDDNDDRYDALGSTAGTSVNEEPTRETPVSIGDEADAAAGGTPKSSSQLDPSLTTFVLAMILFFSAGGGPFGVEPSLKAAGNLYAIIGFAAMPFLWALPEAVMTYELSSAYPCASGGVRWTEEAFGEACGLFVGYLGWVAGITDSASCPVLFLSYVHNHYFPHISDVDIPWIRFGILVGIATVLSYVNYRGLDVVGKASALIFVVTIAPFILLVIIGIPKVDPQKWLMTPTDEVEVFDDDSLTQQGLFPSELHAGIYFRPLINNLYWNFNGFDQGGHFSHAVSKRTLRNGIGLSFLMVSSSYMIPILIATGATDLKQSEWKAGSLATAATEIGGRWLGSWVVFASGVSLLAQFISGMSADSLQLQGMADRGQLPSFFSRRSPHDTPTYGLLLSLLMIVVLLPLQFGFIIELSNFAFCISVIVEFFAFAELSIRKGDCTMLRKTAYVIMLIPPMLFNIAVLLLASYATYIYGAGLSVFGALLIVTKNLDSPCSFCDGRIRR